MTEMISKGMTMTLRLSDRDITFSMDEIFNDYQLYYGWDGRVINVTDMSLPTEFEELEYWQPTAEERDFLENQQIDEIRRIHWYDSDDGTPLFYYGFWTYLDTIEELRDITKNTVDSSLKLPEYIPSGYSIESIRFAYAVNDEILKTMPYEVIISERGNEMHIFRLSEDNRENTWGYIISCINEAGGKLDIVGEYFVREYMGRIHGFAHAFMNSNVSVLEIDGFDRAIMVIMADDERAAINTPHWRRDQVQICNFIATGYGNEEYTFYVMDDSNIGENEMIKLVENLAPVR